MRSLPERNSTLHETVVYTEIKGSLIPYSAGIECFMYEHKGRSDEQSLSYFFLVAGLKPKRSTQLSTWFACCEPSHLRLWPLRHIFSLQESKSNRGLRLTFVCYRGQGTTLNFTWSNAQHPVTLMPGHSSSVISWELHEKTCIFFVFRAIL